MLPVTVAGCPAKSIPEPRPLPLIVESGLYIYGVGSKLFGLKPSPLDQNPLNLDCFLADRFLSPKMAAMMRMTRQPMTIPAIAPVESLGSFLAAWVVLLSGIFTDDGLIIDKDGVVGGSETVDDDGNNVGIGVGVAAAVDDSSLVEITSPEMLIVGSKVGAGTNVVVVSGEGMSGVSVGIWGWTTVTTVTVTGAVSWPSSLNCLSFKPRATVSSSVLPWTLPLSLLCHPFLLYFACIPRPWYRAKPVT